MTGTHGKTTTRLMAVQALQGAGLDPAYVVGGELRSTGTNAGWGTGEWIVVEADESDRSLLKLQPEIAVLTNAELDHHSTYSSRLDLEETFATFMSRAGERAVVWDRPSCARCAPAAACPTTPRARPGPEGSRFAWRGIEVRLSVPGAHNAVNAAGALTACALAGADPAGAAAALADFRGARRRMERWEDRRRRCRCTTTTPTIPPRWPRRSRPRGPRPPAAGSGVPAAPLLAHARARAGFGVALAAADPVVVLGIYPARERAEDFPGVDGHLVAAGAADAAAGRRSPGCRGSTRPGVPGRPAARGDLCLMMGAGNVDALARSLVA